MEDKIIQEISEVVQSSNINFLFGAGSSCPFFPPLGNIEQELNKAKTTADREKQLKEYFTKVMLPNKDILSKDLSGNTNYKVFVIGRQQKITPSHCHICFRV